MAASGSKTVAIRSWLDLRFRWQIVSQNETNRTSTVKWYLELITQGGTINASAQKVAGVVVNGNKYSFGANVSIEANQTKQLGTGNTVITHNTDGTKTFSYSFMVDFQVTLGDGKLGIVEGNGTGILDPVGAIKPVFTHAPSINDEDTTFSIYFKNQGGSSYDFLQVCISSDRKKTEVPYKTIPKTSTDYQFNLTEDEKKALRKSVTSGSSRTIYYYLKFSYLGEIYYASQATTYTLLNYEPTLNPTVEDTNATTIALTGDKHKLIKYASNAKFTTGAVVRKEATVKSQGCSNEFASISGASGTFNGTEGGNFDFHIRDNRGFEVRQTISRTLIDYFKPTCNLKNSQPTATGTTLNFTVTGTWFNGSFGAASNTLTVQYRYKINEGSFSSWTTITATKSGNNYTAKGTLSGLDYKNTYRIEARAKDKLFTINSTSNQSVVTPVFDWSSADFNFNVPVTITDGFVKYPLMGVINAMTKTYNCSVTVTPGDNYSTATGSASICGNTLRCYINANRSSAFSGDGANELVATVSIVHNGKISGMLNVSFPNGASGAASSLYTSDVSQTMETLDFSIYIAATAGSTTALSSYFSVPITLNLDSFV